MPDPTLPPLPLEPLPDQRGRRRARSATEWMALVLLLLAPALVAWIAVPLLLAGRLLATRDT